MDGGQGWQVTLSLLIELESKLLPAKIGLIRYRVPFHLFKATLATPESHAHILTD